MNRWDPHLHWSFEGEHVLLPNLHLDSLPNFILSCVLTISVCVIERCLSVSLDRHLAPPYVKRLLWRYAGWRTVVYGLATCMRLCYMLIAMTCNMGLILVIIVSLACAQLVLVELPESRSEDARFYTSVPAQDAEGEGHSLNARSRRRQRPGSIYIHPSNSNISRADAIALELGMNSNSSVENDHKIGDGWQPGRGRETAMALFGSEARPLQ